MSSAEQYSEFVERLNLSSAEELEMTRIVAALTIAIEREDDAEQALSRAQLERKQLIREFLNARRRHELHREDMNQIELAKEYLA